MEQQDQSEKLDNPAGRGLVMVPTGTEPQNEFEKIGQNVEEGFFSDLWYFLRTNKKWWLLPILVILLGLAALAVLAATPAAPFIYTLF